MGTREVDVIAVTEEQDALAESVRRWAGSHASVAAARQVVDGDGDDTMPSFWEALAAQGLLAVHVPESHGGAGGSVADLAVITEQLGRALAPGPFVPTTATSLVLLAAGDGAAAKELLPGLADGSRTGCVALARGVTGVRDGDGLRVSGTVRPVLGAALADVVIVGVAVDDQTVWVAVDTEGVQVAPIDSFDASRRLAELTFDDVVVRDDRILEVGDEQVRDAVTVVFGAEAAGLAGWCLDTAAEYAKVREQFGRPIGQFQAVKHRCADMLVRAEMARAAAWDAAVAFDDPPQRSIAATVAGAVAIDAGVDNANDCIQVLGGVGFTWEHDAHLYLKRALSLRQLLGGTGAYRRRAAELALAGQRRQLEVELAGDEADRHRAEVRTFVESVAELEPQQVRDRLAETGYAVPHWPQPWGRGAGAVEQLVIDEEFAAAGVAKPNLVIGGWILPTVIAHGTPEQQERFIHPTVRGEIVWCQMFSEPNAGSDLAALQTRAERVDGGWLLSGQKVWTSMAHKADWALCLARTDPDAPKHEGITGFLIDVKGSDGLDVRPLREITGMALFNEIFLDEVFVPDDLVLGEVNDGWRLARTTLSNERVAMSSGSSMGSGVEGVLDLVNGTDHEQDPVVLDQLGRLAAEGQTTGVLGLRTTLRALSGTEPGAASSVRKLAGTDNAMACAELGLDLLGPEGATNEGRAQQATFTFLNSRCLSIAGGTTAVQKNVVAERMLGLPRDDAE